ncbi:MAG: class I SAM-dependent methyltransferase [Pseudomonadota bacterium]
MFQTLSQSIFKGVSWKHPLIAAGLRVLNPIDYAVRVAGGRGHYPQMSIRVRSNGLRRQFNGKRFESLGASLKRELQGRAGLTPQSQVLEIGCGCGRFAFALADTLEQGGYTGVDIDKPSIEAANRNAFLSKKRFTFQHIDVHNTEYNPGGTTPASQYRFDFPENSFDVVFLVSVFTHMLPDDVRNYIKEIGRILKPGGRVMLTTFIMDVGTTFGEAEFVYGSGPYRSSHKDMHEICVGYFAEFFDECFAQSGLEPLGEPVYSTKERLIPNAETTDFDQDLVLAQKPAPAA